MAGHTGDAQAALAALSDSSPAVRATALGALARLGALTSEQLEAALPDPAPEVRRRACELAAGVVELQARVVAALGDEAAVVVEAACFALGEAESSAAVPALSGVAVSHADPLCREAAVAALGSIGDEAGLPAILAATGDKPAVRRRAVLALASFDGPEAEAAITRALSDRDWQVRQAAEDLSGR